MSLLKIAISVVSGKVKTQLKFPFFEVTDGGIENIASGGRDSNCRWIRVYTLWLI
jgi:hypothetical protein